LFFVFFLVFSVHTLAELLDALQDLVKGHVLLAPVSLDNVHFFSSSSSKGKKGGRRRQAGLSISQSFFYFFYFFYFFLFFTK
jgi:hypothetical protein